MYLQACFAVWLKKLKKKERPLQVLASRAPGINKSVKWINKCLGSLLTLLHVCFLPRGVLEFLHLNPPFFIFNHRDSTFHSYHKKGYSSKSSLYFDNSGQHSIIKIILVKENQQIYNNCLYWEHQIFAAQIFSLIQFSAQID